MMRLTWLLLGVILGAAIARPGAGLSQTPGPSISDDLLRAYNKRVEEFVGILRNQTGLTLAQDEDIRDVAAFVMSGASARSGILLFDTKDASRERLNSEALAEAKFWCWLPGLPPKLKEQNRALLQSIRRPLVTGAYAREVVALASGTTLALRGDVMSWSPIKTTPAPIFNQTWVAAAGRKPLTSAQLLREVARGDLTYDAVLNVPVLSKYLQIK